MWDLPGSGTEPVSPALSKRFFTAEPQGKPWVIYSEQKDQTERREEAAEPHLAAGFMKSVPEAVNGPLISITHFFLLGTEPHSCRDFLVDSVKNAIQETQVQSLGWADPLEKGMPTHSSICACTIPWTEKPGGLQSMG